MISFCNGLVFSCFLPPVEGSLKRSRTGGGTERVKISRTGGRLKNIKTDRGSTFGGLFLFGKCQYPITCHDKFVQVKFHPGKISKISLWYVKTLHFKTKVFHIKHRAIVLH